MTRRLIAVALLVLVSVVCARPQQPPALARADEFFTSLEKALLAAPDIRPHLAAGAPVLAGIVRKDPRVAKAWQLEPELAASLSDQEILDYVVMRTNISLVCALDIMQTIPLATVDRAALARIDARRTYLPAAAAGSRTLSPDCATIENGPGQPARIANRQEFTAFATMPLSMDNARAMLKQKTNAEAAQRLEQNLAYLRKAAGGTQPAPEVAAAAQLPSDAVATRQVLNLVAYVRLDRPAPELVLVTPFSW